MSWLLPTLASAILLGFYDYFKKLALRDNAVMPVLFGSAAAGALVWLPLLAWSMIAPGSLPAAFLHVPPLPWAQHLMLAGKAALVGLSWWLGYCGIRALPLSTAAPIRATAPLWTALMAVAFLGESPSPRQWLGVATVLAAFIVFSTTGRKGGARQGAGAGIGYMIGATLTGALAALYDKYLLGQVRISPSAVQAWFTIYMTLMLAPVLLIWRRMRNRHAFHWHWAIPVIGVTLLAADLLYFTALTFPGAMISLVSPVRRTSAAISFLLGATVLREKPAPIQWLCLLAIIGGILLLA